MEQCRHGPSWPWVDLYGDCILSSCASRADCAPRQLDASWIQESSLCGPHQPGFWPLFLCRSDKLGVLAVVLSFHEQRLHHLGSSWDSGSLPSPPPVPSGILVSLPLLEPRCLYPSITSITCACLKSSFIKFIASFPLGPEDCLTFWQAQPMSLGFVNRVWAGLVHCHPRSPCIR